MIRQRWRDPIPASSAITAWASSAAASTDGTGSATRAVCRATSPAPACCRAQGLALSVLTNAVDGLAHQWLEGCVQILRAFAEGGAGSGRAASWTGSWWTLWNPIDLGGRRKQGAGRETRFLQPVPGRERDRAPRSQPRPHCAGPGYASHGEPAGLVRDRRGAIVEVRLGGTRFRAERRVAREMASRYTSRS